VIRHLAAALIAVSASTAFARKPAPPPPPPLEGTVSEVIDGATLVLQTADGKAVTVRLAGIEPPEPCQAWVSESRDALQDFVHDQPVSVKGAARDAKGRFSGTVLADGSDINRRMVEEGHAFSARSKWDRGPYMKEERVAHSLARGMYTTGKVETPTDFRREHGPCAPQAAR